MGVVTVEAMWQDDDTVSVPIPPGREHLAISEPGITVCLAEYLRLSAELEPRKEEPEFIAGSPLPKAERQGLGVMLYDPGTKSGHVILVRAISDDMMSFAYDDRTWPDGKSFFSEGENSLGLDAAYLGPNAPGTWAVTNYGLMRALYAIPFPASLFEAWKEIADDADTQMDIYSAKVDGRTGQALALSAKRKLGNWLSRL
jgi:hypothetical protein